MFKFFADAGINKAAVIRIIVFALAWLNQYLVNTGLQPLPVLDEATVAAFVTFVVSVWTLAKNNQVKKDQEHK